jgi:hypothetical protein
MLGVRAEGGRVSVLGLTVEEASAPPPEPALLRDDLSPARAAERGGLSLAAPSFPAISGGGRGGAPRYGFGGVRALDLPHKERALGILYSLGSHAGVLAVMKRRGWFVPLLAELPPGASVTRGVSDAPAHLLGLNSGDAIHLLLRTDDGLGFRRVAADAAGYDGAWLLDVLYHELAHIEVGGDNPHTRAFYDLEKQVKTEAEAAYPWKRGAGRAVGGGASGGQRFAGWAEAAGDAPAEQPEGQLLGGDRSAAAEGLTAREAAARAAEARLAAAKAAADEERARAEGGGGGGGAPRRG